MIVVFASSDSAKALGKKATAKAKAGNPLKKKPAAKAKEEPKEEDPIDQYEEEGEEEEVDDGEAMEEEEEEQNEEEEDTGEDSIVAKAKAAAYKKFWNKLSFAPKAVQDKVKDIKSMAFRAGKREQLQKLALAYAKGRWQDKVFKSIESLDEERSRGKELTIPRVLMRAKCGGQESFNQAWG
jgi:hypothetical protein